MQDATFAEFVKGLFAYYNKPKLKVKSSQHSSQHNEVISQQCAEDAF